MTRDIAVGLMQQAIGIHLRFCGHALNSARLRSIGRIETKVGHARMQRGILGHSIPRPGNGRWRVEEVHP